jgi:hypothetical protein
MSKRDDFTKATIDILAKRVGYLCSNPDCRKHTVGPNDNPEKSTTIGVAAHITAAASEGPRYNRLLSTEQRTHIDNGIWLCSNCATFIDKDEVKFTVELLNQWKMNAENELLEHLQGKRQESSNKRPPFLEADLIWNGASRVNCGYSSKNSIIIEDDTRVMVIDLSQNNPIIFWEIRWRLLFSIHNNSSVAAYNIAVEEIGEVKFDSITKLNKINNLPPYRNIDLEAIASFRMESSYKEADKRMEADIPEHLEGLTLRISYRDEDRNDYATIVQIQNGQIMNTRE